MAPVRILVERLDAVRDVSFKETFGADWELAEPSDPEAFAKSVSRFDAALLLGRAPQERLYRAGVSFAGLCLDEDADAVLLPGLLAPDRLAPAHADFIMGCKDALETKGVLTPKALGPQTRRRAVAGIDSLAITLAMNEPEAGERAKFWLAHGLDLEDAAAEADLGSDEARSVTRRRLRLAAYAVPDQEAMLALDTLPEGRRMAELLHGLAREIGYIDWLDAVRARRTKRAARVPMPFLAFA